MSDQQMHQAAQQAWHDIARMHEHALHAVWHQFPAPQPRRAHSGPDQPHGTPTGQASPSPEQHAAGRHWPSEDGPQ